MLRDKLCHGFAQTDWNAAKDEARVSMIRVAKRQRTIAYSEVVKNIKSVKFDAHDTRFFHMLGEISIEEDAAGRGMLTAVVVHKVGVMEPGPGFFELAESLGKDNSNKLDCWIKELHKVFKTWSKK